jgi:hypothetical protein
MDPTLVQEEEEEEEEQTRDERNPSNETGFYAVTKFIIFFYECASFPRRKCT